MSMPPHQMAAPVRPPMFVTAPPALLQNPCGGPPPWNRRPEVQLDGRGPPLGRDGQFHAGWQSQQCTPCGGNCGGACLGGGCCAGHCAGSLGRQGHQLAAPLAPGPAHQLGAPAAAARHGTKSSNGYHDEQFEGGRQSPSAPAMISPAPPPPPLADGDMVTIGRHRFLPGEAIGEGAYARVWAAWAPSGSSVGSPAAMSQSAPLCEEAAIKEMKCGQGPGILPDASLQRAMFEVQVMKRLQSVAEEGVEVCAPRVIDHQFWRLGPSAPGAYLCRVAMTRRRGQPLVNWLEETTTAYAAQQGLRAHPAPAVGHDIEFDPSAYCASFCRAAFVARALLTQLSTTFERLNQGIAYHRDVNARNILVYSPASVGAAAADSISAGGCDDGAAPRDVSAVEFSVVDFGSSTDAQAWHGLGEGSWQVENPTGDARYWSPASWVRFLGGAQALAQDAGLLRQYSQRLDLFALAVCAMELLLKLHTSRYPQEASERSGATMLAGGGCAAGAGGDKGRAPPDRSAATSRLEQRLAPLIQRVRTSWQSYWSFAVRSFDHLAEYSRLVCCGDTARAGQTWNELLHGEIPNKLRDKLHRLCMDCAMLGELCTLQVAGGACGAAACGTWRQVGSTLIALRDMLHEGSPLGWSELSERVAPPMMVPRPLPPGGVLLRRGASLTVEAHHGNDVRVAGTASTRGSSVVVSSGSKSRTPPAPLPPSAIAVACRSPHGLHAPCTSHTPGVSNAPHAWRNSTTVAAGPLGAPATSGGPALVGSAAAAHQGRLSPPRANSASEVRVGGDQHPACGQRQGKSLFSPRGRGHAAHVAHSGAMASATPLAGERLAAAAAAAAADALAAPGPGAPTVPGGLLRLAGGEEPTGGSISSHARPSVRRPQRGSSPLRPNRTQAAAAAAAAAATAVASSAAPSSSLNEAGRAPGGSLRVSSTLATVAPPLARHEATEPSLGPVAVVADQHCRPQDVTISAPLGHSRGVSNAGEFGAHGPDGGGVAIHGSIANAPEHVGDDREHEALRILRQVESEVRTLKKWYTEAISAMRSQPMRGGVNAAAFAPGTAPLPAGLKKLSSAAAVGDYRQVAAARSPSSPR